MAEPYDGGAPNPGHSEPSPSQDNGGFEIPEKFAGKSIEDVIRSYTELESSTGQRMQELEPLIRAQKELEPYGGVNGLQEAYGQIYRNYQQLLEGQQRQQTQPQQTQPQQAADWTEDWDMLSPREQAQKMREQVAQETMGQLQTYGQRLYEEANQRLESQTSAIRQELEIYKALQDVQRQHPDMDATQLLQEAVNMSRSNPQQLLQFATQHLANQDGKQTKAEAQQLFEQWKADEKLKQENAQRESILNPGGQTLRSRFPQDENRPTDTQSIHAEVVRKLLSDPNSGLTPAHFTP